MFRCKTCQKEFTSDKSLDAHLKVHGGIAEYYSTWYPRRDLYSGAFIEFKNKKQYLSSFFNSHENRLLFFRDNFGPLAKDILSKEFKDNKEYKGYSFLPCENYLTLSRLAGVSDIKKLFGSCKDFCEESKVDQYYTSNIPKNFWIDTEELNDIIVHVDTREKYPFKFKNLVYNKLDFGDYTAVGNHYSKTFVDRKSVGDFFSTFGSQSNFDRFKREIQRCREFNSFLFVIVEGSIKDLENFSNKSRFHSGSNFAFHNVRDLLVNDYEFVQFLFCQDRKGANDICKRVLLNGKSLWNCDVQYFLNNHYGVE
jgi:hypothetical protein